MATYEKGLCSICCLGYRHVAFLEQNIHSIWEGEYSNVEIIAVDDGSLDGSAELLESLAGQSPCPMTVIAQQNTGNIGKNFNAALRLAKGEYIAFISLDDVLYPDAISKKIERMNADQRLAFIANSKIMGLDAHGNAVDCIAPLTLDTLESPTIDDLLDLEYREFGSFYIQGTVFRRDVVDAVDGFDEDMTGDDIILRTKVFRHIKDNPTLNFLIFRGREPSCYYRMHGSNVHKNSVRQIKIVTEYLDRYWPDRENPEILLNWTLNMIQHLPLEEYIRIFTLNSRATSLLLEPGIPEAIKLSINKTKNSWMERIFCKHKLSGGRRKIMLFSCIKISYRKKKRVFHK